MAALGPGDLVKCRFNADGTAKYYKIPFEECGQTPDGFFDLEATLKIAIKETGIYGPYECVGVRWVKGKAVRDYTWLYPEYAKATMKTRAEKRMKTAADKTDVDEKTMLENLSDADAITTTIEEEETEKTALGIGALTIAGFALNFLLKKI